MGCGWNLIEDASENQMKTAALNLALTLTQCPKLHDVQNKEPSTTIGHIEAGTHRNDIVRVL